MNRATAGRVDPWPAETFYGQSLVMDPLARRVLARYVEATSGRTDKTEVPALHKPSGRIVHVLRETLKDNPGLYQPVPHKHERDLKPSKPPRPPQPKKPDRSHPPRDPHPRLPAYPAVPRPQSPPPATKPLKRPKPLKPQKVPEPPKPRKRVVVPNKPKTAGETSLAERVLARFLEDQR